MKELAPAKEIMPDGSPPPLEGSVEVLHEKTRRAMQLRSFNYDLAEIADIIGKEFECPPPSLPTVCQWIARYHEAADADCIEFRNKRRQQQDLILSNLLKRWLPVAAAEKLCVTRYAKVEGMTVPYTDENAYDEQSKAAVIVVKLLERLSKLWHLDLEKDTNGDKEKGITPETLSLLVIQQLNNQPPSGAPIDIEAKTVRLELHAGDMDIDEV